MMEEIEKGNIGTVLVKDMSRLGRDYLKVGQIVEEPIIDEEERYLWRDEHR